MFFCKICLLGFYIKIDLKKYKVYCTNDIVARVEISTYIKSILELLKNYNHSLEFLLPFM